MVAQKPLNTSSVGGRVVFISWIRGTALDAYSRESRLIALILALEESENNASSTMNSARWSSPYFFKIFLVVPANAATKTVKTIKELYPRAESD